MITTKTVIENYDEIRFVDCFDENGNKAKVMNVYFQDEVRSFLLNDNSYTIDKIITLSANCPEVILTYKTI